MYPLGSQASTSMLMSAGSGNAFTQMLHVTGMPPYNPQIFTYPPCTSSFMAPNFQSPTIPVSIGFSAPQSPGFLSSQPYASVNQSIYPPNIFNSQIPMQLWNQPQIPMHCQSEGMGHQRTFAHMFHGAMMRQQLAQTYNPPVLLPEGYPGSFGVSSQLRFIHQCAHERVTIQQSTQLYGNHVLNGPDMSARGPLSTIFQACDSDLRRSSSSQGNEKQNSFIASSSEESQINQRVEIEELEQEDHVEASAERLPRPLVRSSNDCSKGDDDSPHDENNEVEIEECGNLSHSTSSEVAGNHDAQNTDVDHTKSRSSSPMLLEHEPFEECNASGPKLHRTIARDSSSVIKSDEKHFYQSQLSSATSIVLRRSQGLSTCSPLSKSETVQRQQWRRKNAVRRRMITRGERPVLGRIRRKPPVRSYMKKSYRFSVSKLPKAAISEVVPVPKRKRGRPRKILLPADAEAEEMKDTDIDLFAKSTSCNEFTEKNVVNCDIPAVSPSRNDKIDPEGACISSMSSAAVANEDVKNDVVCFAKLVVDDLPGNLGHHNSNFPREIETEDPKENGSCNGKSDAFMKLMGLSPRELKSKIVEVITPTSDSPVKEPTVESHPPCGTPHPSPIKTNKMSADTTSAAASSPATPSRIVRRSPRQLESESHQASDVPLPSPSSSRPRGNKRITRNNERKVVFSNRTSDRVLRHISDRTLRLRVRSGGVEVNRKWKLKWDGPLFPKIPLSTAEKRLERYALARMQSWTLNPEAGETYLHRAAKEGDKDVVLYCLKFDGFHPRCTNNRGHTALHEACKAKDKSLEVAKVLIDHGAYHSQPSRANIRPLHVASREGNLDLVKFLLSLGADPHLLTLGDTNCFDLAESHPQVAKFLEKYSNLS